MKKITIVSLASFLFLSISSLVAYFLKYLSIDNPWITLAIGVGILIFSGVIALFANKKILLNIFCFFISSVALGFCIRGWYIYRNFDNPLWLMLLISLVCVIYLLIFYLLLYIPFFDKHFNIYIWVFLGLSLIGYIFLIAFTNTTYISTFGYYSIIEIAFIFAMCRANTNYKHLIRNITLSTYSVFVVAIIIALIMLECDSFDFDFGGRESKIVSPKNQKVRKFYD